MKPVMLHPDATEVQSGTDTAVIDNEPKEDVEEIEINGVVDNLYITEGKKGRGKGKLFAYLKPDLNNAQPFSNIQKMVGIENWNRCIIEEFLRPIFREVTKASIDPETGQISLQSYAGNIRGEFLHPGRGGDGKKELRKKKDAVGEEIAPFLLILSQNKAIPGEDQPRFRELMLEWSELNAKLEEKERKGKAKKEAAVAA